MIQSFIGKFMVFYATIGILFWLAWEWDRRRKIRNKRREAVQRRLLN